MHRADRISFLNDLDRVTDINYTVTDDDVVRARLRTLGIQEYMITFKEGLLDKGPLRNVRSLKFDPLSKAGLTSGWTWRIFDVGGCRTSVSDAGQTSGCLTNLYVVP